jgi:pyridoxine 5-phosphate synthase
MVAIARGARPDAVCIVPENRAELTTEGGLDVLAERERVQRVVPLFREAGVLVSLFVDPDPEAIEAAAASGAQFVELHTGAYANATGASASGAARSAELSRLVSAAERAHAAGLRVNAGHGLTAENVGPIARLPHLEELNVGYSIVSRSLFLGVDGAVREMLRAIQEARA